MALPAGLQQDFKSELKRYEEDRKMPFITSFERDGIEIGLQQGQLQNCRENILEILQTRFEQVPDSLEQKINQISDLSSLKEFFKQSITITSVTEFEQLLNTGTTSN